MIVNKELLEELFNQFDPLYQQRIEEAIAKIIAAKNENQKICSNRQRTEHSRGNNDIHRRINQ